MRGASGVPHIEAAQQAMKKAGGRKVAGFAISVHPVLADVWVEITLPLLPGF